MLPNVVKETAVTMALNIQKKTKRLTNWPNIATKFAKRGTHKSLLLLNWSSWHHAASAMQWTEFESNTQSSTSPGESCARLPAGRQPHRRLWYHRQSTWSAQKKTVGIKGRQSVFRSSCKWLLHVRPFATVYFTFFVLSMLPNVDKETAVTIALTFEQKCTGLTNWPNIATKFARRGTIRNLLLSNWSSWHHAASAMWTEFESNTQSSTSPGESCARLPAGLRPHRCLWCPCESTSSAQKWTVGIKGRQSVFHSSCKWLFESLTICNCLFHIFGLSMLPNVDRETAVTIALTFKQKKHSI